MLMRTLDTQGFTWSTWFGATEAASYLTDEGRDLASRAARDLEEFFGSKWIRRATDVSRPGRPLIATLGRTAPILAMADGFRSGAYIEGIRWWAALTLLSHEDVPAWRTVRNDVRQDVKADRFAHTLAQARLVGLGLQHGAAVTLEPDKGRGPGDVLLELGASRLFIEVMTLNRDANLQQGSDFFDRCTTHLRANDASGAVHWIGDLPEFLGPAQWEAWKQKTVAAVSLCSQRGVAVSVECQGRVVTVAPGPQPAGSGLRTTVAVDPARRLLSKLEKKADTTQGAAGVWIWVEELEDDFPSKQLSRLPLREKVAHVGTLTRDLLKTYPHLAGVVWSTCVPVSPEAVLPDEDVSVGDGLGWQRWLPVDRLRHTVVVPGRVMVPGQMQFLSILCRGESAWLAWALERLGVPGGPRRLLSGDAEPRIQSLLWTP
jgi:hypothetical protein